MAKTSLYWNEVLEVKLGPYRNRYGSLGKAVTIVTDRYSEMMSTERRSLKEIFNQNEINLMLNNALSTTYEPAGVIINAVWADTEDEIQATFEYYEVSREEIIGKLRRLTIGQQFSLVDWLEEMRGNDPHSIE